MTPGSFRLPMTPVGLIVDHHEVGSETLIVMPMVVAPWQVSRVRISVRLRSQPLHACTA